MSPTREFNVFKWKCVFKFTIRFPSYVPKFVISSNWPFGQFISVIPRPLDRPSSMCRPLIPDRLTERLQQVINNRIVTLQEVWIQFELRSIQEFHFDRLFFYLSVLAIRKSFLKRELKIEFLILSHRREKP